MRKALTVGVLLLIAALGIGIGKRVLQTIPPRPAPPAPAGASELAAGNNTFALKLYAELAQQPGNIVFSPYSIASATALLRDGASGKTAQEIDTLFGLPQSVATRRTVYQGLQARYNPRNAAFQLNAANALWIDQQHPVLKSYVKVLQQNYAAQATNLDFRNGLAAATAINKWAAAETKGRIKSIVPAAGLSVDTPLVLTSAIYFKGRWEWQFKPRATRREAFHSPDGMVQVPMMHLYGHEVSLNFMHDEELLALELPYVGDDMAMLLILPANGQLSDLHLTGDRLQQVVDSLAPTEIAVALPRFKFEPPAFALNATLSKLGMPTAYGSKADFAGIDGTSQIFLGATLHQAMIEVDEQGTVAAATTANIGCAKSEQPDTFVADRPFIFMIRDLKTNMILFMGRVDNPLW
jgi:serpin B